MSDNITQTITPEEGKLMSGQAQKMEQLLAVIDEGRDELCRRKFEQLLVDFAPDPDFPAFAFTYVAEREENCFFNPCNVTADYFVWWMIEQRNLGRILMRIDVMGKYIVSKSDSYDGSGKK